MPDFYGPVVVRVRSVVGLASVLGPLGMQVLNNHWSTVVMMSAANLDDG